MSAPPAEWHPIEGLKPWKKNVRTKHDVEGIAESIRLFGWGEVLVARRKNKELIGGHGTLKAAQLLAKWWENPEERAKKWHPDARRTAEHKEVPVRFVNLSAKESHELAVALNRLAELSRWHPHHVKEVIDGAEEARRKAMGFTSAAIASLARKTRQRILGEDLDGLEPPSEPITQPGDLIILGGHRVLCADSLVEEHQQRLLDGAQSTLVVTDPSFAIYGSATGVASDVADYQMVIPYFEQILRACHRLLPVYGHAYIHTDWRSWTPLYIAAHRAEMTAKNMLVWDKGDGGLGTMWANCHELIGFWVKEPSHDPTTMRGRGAKKRKSGQRTVHRPNMLRHSRATGAERLHNAAKPVAMEAELITAGSDSGDIVLDFFLGSGSTLIAAEDTGRRCFGFDTSAKCCDIVAARWERKTGKSAERKGTA